MRDDPLPVKVAASIRQRIRAGEFRIGQKLPSERLLAEEADVSRQVVRQAIADLSRQGILDCLPRCRPVVIGGARPGVKLPIKDKRIYLLVFPYVSDFIASQVLKGVQRGMADPDLNLVISTPGGGHAASQVDAERLQLLSIAADPLASGAIVWYSGGQRNLGALQSIRDSGIPIVFVDREAPDGFDADFVGTDNFEASRNAVRHLVDLGHRRIGMLTNLDSASSVFERQEGYKAAVLDAGHGFFPELMTPVNLDGATFEEAVKHGISRLLNLPQPPTAIFAVNDQIALRLLPILGSLGVSVPNDVSVVGFDGWLRWMPGGGNLTSAAQQFERIGHLATRLLLDRMHIGEPKAYRHLLLEAPLIHKGSTQAHCQLAP